LYYFSQHNLWIDVYHDSETYDHIVWHKKTELATTRKTLEKVQRFACLCITGAMRSTTTTALEVILDFTRRTAWGAHLRMDKAGFKRRAHSARDSLPTGSAHLADLPTDKFIRKFSFEKQFRQELSTKRDWSRESIQTLGKNTIILYTDGSKTPEGTGAGVYAPNTPNPWASFLAFFKGKFTP